MPIDRRQAGEVLDVRRIGQRVRAEAGSKRPLMFTVDEATAEAIRRAFNESGELAAVVELRLHSLR